MVLHYEKFFFFCTKRRATLKCDERLESIRRSEIVPSYDEDENIEDEFESLGEDYPKTAE